MKFDLTQFLIHAFFGAVVGVIAGFTFLFFIGFFVNVNELVVISISAVVYALIAGFMGDEFWDKFRRL